MLRVENEEKKQKQSQICWVEIIIIDTKRYYLSEGMCVQLVCAYVSLSYN